MPESADKLSERLAGFEDDLADARAEVERLRREAAEARAEGRDGEADEFLADLPDARDRVSNLEATIPIVREELERAETAARRDAARRRLDELATQVSVVESNATRAGREARDLLAEGLAKAREALEGPGKVDRLQSDARILAALFDLDKPDFPDVDLGDLRGGTVLEVKRELEGLLRAFPEGAGGDSHNKRQAVRALLSDPTDATRYGYSRATSIRSRLTDATLAVCEDKIVERLRAHYESLPKADQDRTQRPRPAE